MSEAQLATDYPIAGPEVEKLNYAAECLGLDFGLINARNQLIKQVCNPLLDMIINSIKEDRALRSGTDSETKYKVAIVISSTRDIDTVQ
jgi:hypothetical protein